MGERTSHTPDTISWSDLGTSDPDAAKTFYTSLFGWEYEDMPIPQGGAYTKLRKDGKDAAALSSAQEGMPPRWNCWVTMESAEDAAAKAAELGATVMAEPFDVMDAGRMAVIQDPTGTVFSVWEPRQHIGARVVNGPGPPREAVVDDDYRLHASAEAAFALILVGQRWSQRPCAPAGGSRSQPRSLAAPPRVLPERNFRSAH